MLLQMIGGTFLALSAYFTWSQVAISRDGQVTERYGRTIDQLGSKNRSVRLGAVYGLQRIARDSTGDSATIASILVAYIRSHSAWKGIPQIVNSRTQKACPSTSAEFDELNAISKMRVREADVQAAMDALRTDPLAYGDATNDLAFQEVDLRQSNFSEAYLWRADFRGSNLAAIDLSDASLDGANFGSDNGAYCNVHLEWADLRGASLDGAQLNGARLDSADLRGADLSGANLTGAKLTDAYADSQTKWPTEFDPISAGVKFAEK
jgi:hypothetical protein